jgi:hypothetical protein
MKAIRLVVLFTMIFMLLGLTTTSAALADSASGKGDGLHPTQLTVANGMATFDTCKGTCTATDIDPASVGPVRPWQIKGPKANANMLTFELTGKGIWTSLVDSTGVTQSYTGLPCVVCINYTSDEASAAGGKSKLRVAYWAANLTNCNDDWALPCLTKVKGNWHVLQTTYASGQACALLRLTGSFALVKVTGP